jgi:hypothetical protein
LACVRVRITTLSLADCKRELIRLLPMAKFADNVEWNDPWDDQPEYFLVISDGIALGVKKGAATTVLVRAGNGEVLAPRRQARKAKRRHKREDGRNRHGRMSHRIKAQRRAEEA